MAHLSVFLLAINHEFARFTKKDMASSSSVLGVLVARLQCGVAYRVLKESKNASHGGNS